MTDTPLDQPKVALGVGALIGDSFSILLGNFLKVVIIAFVPVLLGFLLTGGLIGFDAALGVGEPTFDSPGSSAAFGLAFVVEMVIYSLTTALLVQLAYDAKLNRPVQPGRYIGPALSALVPVAILSLVAGLLAGIGTLLFVIPGLWLYAVFSVMVPAVVIERVGFGGLGRSARLTKQYRWPIIGALLLALILIIVINLVVGLVIGIVAAIGGTIIAVILYSALSTIGVGYISILIALIYARLREIKEGISVDQIASVFD
ncbi:hypothetical protein [Labrenzia sp. 011]|uniref:hypothetical protein n=1 Tax=Labrenzia sp. 011 TaxID=2171494 RepID=UPI000D5178F5|nr:hypothetical protein [Labrenzia sp. 011]PVB61228.1 hypothetical protein DCO57_13505 [Labrenzia sp. 011]